MSDSLADLPKDMRLAPRALRRAAQRARDVARATRTGLVIVVDGVLVEIPYDQIEDLDLSENEK
jgi:propanediol dehydratase small subunit